MLQVQLHLADGSWEKVDCKMVLKVHTGPLGCCIQILQNIKRLFGPTCTYCMLLLRQ